MTFKEFQATCQVKTPDELEGIIPGIEDHEARAFFTYLDNRLYIVVPKHPTVNGYGLYLPLCSEEIESNKLTDLEELLYDFANNEEYI